MKKINEQRGITLIALVITVILLLIIGGISITKGSDLVEKSKVETIETNMLTIKAKAKEYAENVEALTWKATNSEKPSKNVEAFKKYKMELSEQTGSWKESGYTYYDLSKDALDNMSLGSLWDGSLKYIVGVNEQYEVEIIYLQGVTYKDNTYYKLSELMNVL